MFYLYLKTHNKTGLKYLGYTKNDPIKYKGSGKYWSNHIKIHGNDVTTQILFQSEIIDDISQEGSKYSQIWNIIEDASFANLCEEDGNKLYGKANINFMGHAQTEETRLKISKNNGRGNAGKYGSDHPAYGHKVNHQNYEHLKIARSAITEVWNKGKTGLQTHNEETKLKMSAAKIGIKKQQIECPHCGKIGGKPAMIRFHFDNCKDIQCV